MGGVNARLWPVSGAAMINPMKRAGLSENGFILVDVPVAAAMACGPFATFTRMLMIREKAMVSPARRVRQSRVEDDLRPLETKLRDAREFHPDRGFPGAGPRRSVVPGKNPVR